MVSPKGNPLYSILKVPLINFITIFMRIDYLESVQNRLKGKIRMIIFRKNVSWQERF